MGAIDILLYGMGGGLAAELVGFWKLRHTSRSELPEYLRSWFYWGVTLPMIGLGGGLAWLYSTSDVSLNPILAVNIGASAPLIIGVFAGQTPTIPPGRVD